MVEHQLPKLRAAGSNPVFRSKADRMMQIIRFFCAMTDRCKPCLHKGWNGAKKGCAQHNGLLLEAPAASGTVMPEAKSRFPIQTGTLPYNLSGKQSPKILLQNTFHTIPPYVRYMRYCFGRCSNFVVPSILTYSVCHAELTRLEGKLQKVSEY